MFIGRVAREGRPDIRISPKKNYWWDVIRFERQIMDAKRHDNGRGFIYPGHKKYIAVGSLVSLPLELDLVGLHPILHASGHGANHHVDVCGIMIYLPVEIRLLVGPSGAALKIDHRCDVLLGVVSPVTEPRRRVSEGERKRPSANASNTSLGRRLAECWQ